MSLSVSHSQFSVARECLRQWWLDNVVRLPHAGPVSYELTFGNVLHAVLERWLRAEIDGRDGEGNPVDLYPDGWQWVFDRGRVSRIEPHDEGVIRRLVDLAVARGYLERQPGRKVEAPFGGLLIHGDGTFGAHVLVTGKIDLLLPPTAVTDHKSTKSLRWAVSEDPTAEKYIGNDDQLLLYAKVLAEEFQTQQEFTLTHLIYDRVKVDVTRRSAVVTRAKVEEAWQALKPLALEMVALTGIQEGSLASVPGPFPSDHCTRQYGHPCKFFDLCAGTETLTKYRRRQLRLAVPEIEEQEKLMSSLNERLAALNGGEAPSAPAPAPFEEPFEEPDKCAACSGTGKNSQGGYCVCPLGTRRFKEDAPALEETPASGIAQPKKRGRPKKVTPTEQPPADLLAIDVSQVVDQRTPAVAEKPRDVQPLDTPPPLGPTIFYNCTLLKGPVATVVHTSSGLLRHAVETIGGNTLEEFYKADVWKRRDALKGMGKALAGYVGAGCVLAGSQDGDEQAVIAAIAPYSSVEIGARA